MGNSSKPHVFLSIDFDFFFEENQDFDWGHFESPLFIETIWPIRAASLLASGIDPIEDVGITGKPSELAMQLEKMAWKFKKNSNLSISESHICAYDALKDKTNIEIINIDAHHDLVYSNYDTLDCGNWIYRLALEGRVKKVTIVYPEWRNSQFNSEMDSDYPCSKSLIKMKELGVEVDIVYGISSTYARKVDEVFIARSGAWVPPWLDDEFLFFVRTWMFRCKNIILYGKNSIKEFKRKFDLEEVKIEAAIQSEKIRKMKELHPTAIIR